MTEVSVKHNAAAAEETKKIRHVCPSYKYTGFSCADCAFGRGCSEEAALEMERGYQDIERERKRKLDEDNAAYEKAKKICAAHPYTGPKLDDKKDREIANLKEQITDLNIEIDSLKAQIARLVEASKSQTREKLDVLIAELKVANKDIDTILGT